jgi:hypothetical protein
MDLKKAKFLDKDRIFLKNFPGGAYRRRLTLQKIAFFYISA